MSTELVLLLSCLAVGIILSAFLLIKIIVEVKNFRHDYKESHDEEVKDFQKNFMDKHSDDKTKN